MRTITIQACLNGFIVQVGCQNVVFDSKKTLLHQLSCYLENPKEVEAAYLHNALFKDYPSQPIEAQAQVNDCDRVERARPSRG